MRPIKLHRHLWRAWVSPVSHLPASIETRLAALESEVRESRSQRLEARAELLQLSDELHRVGSDVHRVINALTPIQFCLERIAALTEQSAKRADLAQRNAAFLADHVAAHCIRCGGDASDEKTEESSDAASS